MRTGPFFAVLVALAVSLPAAGASQTSPPPPDGTSGPGSGASAVLTPAARPAPSPPQTFRLNLDKGDQWLLDRGHAEFERGMRQFIWQDPMVRLEMAVQKEQWRQRYAGLGAVLPASISANVAFQQGVSPRLILAGPFASDWQDLTTQERIGRVAETATYAGLIIGLLGWLGKR